MADLAITAASVVADAKARTIYGSCGETIAAGQAVYQSSTSKKWLRADSNSVGEEVRHALGIALNGGSLDQPVKVLKRGKITIGATLIPGAAYYLSVNAGGICPASDVVIGDSVCLLGLASSSTVLDVLIRFVNFVVGGQFQSTAPRNIFANQILGALRQTARIVTPRGFINDGDSLTLGDFTTPYPTQLATRTGLSTLNLGLSGQHLAAMDADYFTHTAPHFNINTANILVLDGGINDIIFNSGATATSIDFSLRSYSTKAHSTGFSLYVFTLTAVKTGVHEWNPGMEAKRQAVNADRRANWRQYAEGLIDLDADAQFDDPTNTAKYYDGLHWTTASNLVAADLVRTALYLPLV